MTVVGISCRRWSTDGVGAPTRVGSLVDYTQALEAAGAATVLLPFQADRYLNEALSRCDGLLLPGGEDTTAGYVGSIHPPTTDPVRDAMELALIRAARPIGLPILGICRGMQLLAVAFGGTISPLGEVVTSPLSHMTRWREGEVYTHAVSTTPGSRLHECVGQMRSVHVNCTHRLCIKNLGTPLRVSAIADDGVIEAIELVGEPFVLGVQWHPECLVSRGDKEARSLFRRFVAACRARPT